MTQMRDNLEAHCSPEYFPHLTMLASDEIGSLTGSKEVQYSQLHQVKAPTLAQLTDLSLIHQFASGCRREA